MLSVAPAGVTPQQFEAYKLARWGFHIGPLNGKIPFTAHGVKDFTNNLDQVTEWWTRWPSANIGARVFAGHVVVDIDPRNGGDTTWAQLAEGHEMPDTLTTLTGSGGLHYWFRLPHTGAIRGTAGAGIDLKTSGGYLVMPGSIHPVTGRYYQCQRWARPALVPAWLAPAVYKPARIPRPHIPTNLHGDGHGLIHAVATAPEGQRNNLLYWAANRAVANNLPIFEELHQAAVNNGLADSEAQRTIDSARQQGSAA